MPHNPTRYLATGKGTQDKCELRQHGAHSLHNPHAQAAVAEELRLQRCGCHVQPTPRLRTKLCTSAWKSGHAQQQTT